MSFPWVSASITSSCQPPELRSSIRLQPKRLSLLIALALGGTAMAVVQPQAKALPPVVAAPGRTDLPRAYDNNAGFAYRGAVKWEYPRDANGQIIPGRMLITQDSLTAIGRFRSFDIGQDASVRFDQKAGNASQFLGRIDATGIPSRIFGTLEANGSVYLINQNGVVFGANSQVNARSFIFSALDIRDEKFLEGFDKGVNNPNDRESLKVFEWNVERAAGGNSDGSNPGNRTIDFDQTYVQVLPGARITTASGGQVLLLAPHVVNGGNIRTPQGQTILGGGAKVYLQFSDEPDLRGMLVEVDPLQSQGGAPIHGSAINAVTGSIAADEGNITLAAFTVKQHGRLTATTSVRQNGSIYLKAQDGANLFIDSNAPVDKRKWELRGANNAGVLEIGNGTDASVTEVNPVASNDTSQDGQGFRKSEILMSGGQITFKDRSLVQAAGGKLNITTEIDKSNNVRLDNTYASTDRWIDIRRGARLDVSGSQDVKVSVSRNFVQTTPYSSELKDTPAQRNGFLYRQPLWIDLRKLPKVADFSGYLSQIERGVGERTATGGNISLTTRGQVYQRQGSSLDVSGGSIQYQGGMGRTTQLVSGSKAYDIGDAPADLNYSGFARVYSRHLNKWNLTQTWGGLSNGKPLTAVDRYHAGYLEGKDAGSINIIASGAVLDGELAGHTTAGQYQRDAATLPIGGQFVLGNTANPLGNRYWTPNVLFSNDRTPVADNVTPDTPVPTVKLAPQTFSEGGFSKVTVASEGSIRVPADVVLSVQPGGSVDLKATQVSVDGRISAPGGSIKLTTTTRSNLFGSNVPPTYLLTLGPDAILSTRGLWTNDMLDPGNPFAPVFTNGGKVTLDSYNDLTLAAGSQVDVSGGGWVNGSGKLQGGAGGDITLNAGDNANDAAQTVQRTSKLTLDGELRGYGIAGGGSLILDVGQVRIGGAPPSVSDPRGLLHLDEGFFQRGGFDKYAVKTRDGLTVAAGATVRPQMERLRVDSDFQRRASGADLYDFTQRELPILAERTPVELNFDATNIEFGKLVVEAGASIATDIGGSVNLSAARQIIVDGAIEAPAGSISLTLNGGNGQEPSSYFADQYIWLGAASRLLAQGAVQTTTDYAGFNRGEVLAGGRIALNAKYGYIVSEERSSMDVSGTSGRVDIVTPGGARTTNIETRQIASDAGEISLTAAEGMLLYGDWRAFAGGDTARGGSLKVEVTTPARQGQPGYLSGSRRIVVSDDFSTSSLPADVSRDGISATSVYNGGAFLALDRVRDQTHVDRSRTGGFDSLSLRASDRIEFTESTRLSMDQRLMLDAPVIKISQSPPGMPGSLVELSAPYLMLGNTPNTQAEGHVGGANVSPGAGELRLQGQLIDLVGDTALQDVGEFAAFADSDIRLRATEQLITPGNANGGRKYEGRLSTSGNITLQADQIYPTTMSDFTLHVNALHNPNGRVTILPGGGHGPVLSAGGRLVIDAPNIDQRGVLKAPFGEINFLAGNSLHLWGGSLTSVSGEGQLIPFGYTEVGGANLYYNYGQDQRRRQFGAGQSAPPQKAVKIRTANFVMDEGAQVDVRGGGDLYTYEFTPGPPGRSIDILDPAARARTLASGDSSAVVRASAQEYEGTYAILPGLGSAFAPYDQQAYLGAGAPIPGSSVYLSGVPGLAAGTYALLPARYALLPGAFLIKQVSGHQDMTARQRSLQPDGTYLTSGYFTNVTNPGTTVRDARTSGFEIRSADSVKFEADYGTRTLSNWIASNGTAWQAPADAGRLVINATQTLELNGTLRGAPDASRQGQGGQVDILGTNIIITDDATPDDNLPTTVQVKASSLSNLGADSLLVGGERSNTASGVRVDVGGATVTVANSANELRAPEIMLTATDNLTLSPNSVIRANGNARLSQAPLTLTSNNPNNVTPGQSAFVRVASGAQVGVLRAHDRNNPGTVGDDTGTLVIGAGARLIAESNSGGQSSMILDATHSMTNNGALLRIGSTSAPGDLAIGASRISLGAVPANVADPGLILNNQQLADLGELNTLDLRSYSSIDVYGGAQLSARTNLGLEAGQIRGLDNAAGSAAAIHAGQDLRISNPNGIVSPTASSAGTGMLAISTGRDLTLGKASAVPNSGAMSIGGYQNVSLSAGRDLAVDGKGSLTVAADLALNAQRITGRSGANFEIKAQDSPTAWRSIVTGSAQTPWQGTLPAITDVAARLKIAGGSLTHGGVINLPSGVLRLEANGLDGDVEILNGASIVALGAVKQFDTQYVYAAGGAVTLSSANGDVILNNGASIDVSGAEGGDAGSITVQATRGEFDLKGQMRGMASTRSGQTTRPAGGGFTLDVESIADFTDTNGAIVDGFTHVNRALQAGGFNASRHVRVRGDNENLVLAASELITARDVRLVADAGDVDIAGDIDARGTRGGHVELWADGAVRVRDGAVIDASALPSTTTPRRGGSVLLATQDSSANGVGVNVEAGATINVAGTGGLADSGDVHVRAPRIASGGTGTPENEVAIRALRGTIRGTGQITIEAFKAYTPAAGVTLYDSINGTNGALSEASSFMSGAGATIGLRLRNELTLGGNTSGVVDRLQVRPGIEIESAGNLQLDTALNLAGASNPGVLTLRTAGNLTFNANLSDGFSTATSTGVLQAGESWSYRLVAGADLDAADAMAVQPLDTLAAGGGNFSMAANTLVRTGTGDIDIAAGRDVSLGSGAVIYTAGRPDVAPLANFVPPTSPFQPSYPLDGGDLSIQAQGNITSAQPRDANGVAYQQVVTDWLWRQGNFNTGADQRYLTWYPRFDLFKQGVAAFGGGDVRVAAGGNMDNFSVALPTNGRLPATVSPTGVLVPDPDNKRVLGGGAMTVTAGEDILSGVYYLGAGTGRIQSRGSLGSAINVSRSTGNTIPSQPLYTVLALADGQLDVSAGGQLSVQAIINPTVFPIAPRNISRNPSATTTTLVNNSLISNFYTYGTDSAVSLTALAGDVRLENNYEAIKASSNRLFDLVGAYDPKVFLTSIVYPPSLRAASLDGDVVVNPFTLYPSPGGQLELFAGGTVRLLGAINAPDIWPDNAPTVATLLKPHSGAASYSSIGEALNVGSTGFNAHSVDSNGDLLHADDLEPIRIIALTGDVIGIEGGIGNFPKPLVLQAGRDLIDVGFYGQNLDDNDITRIQAGRDLRFTTWTDTSGKLRSTEAGIFIGGPGRVEVIAGRNVDLGTTKGILTKGNINNPHLPEGGASLMVLAGAVPALSSYPAFIAYYVQGGCVDGQASYICDLREIMRTRTGETDLSDAEALAQFNSLPPEQQTAFVNHVLFSELRRTGRDAIDPQAQAYATYDRGYDAIARLFPSSSTGPAPAGNINLYYSQLKTEQGGDIELLAPYGRVVAGLPTATVTTSFNKSAAELGIVTVNGGAISAMTRDDFLVNSQRVFTLQGGDILLWSSEGNIDAGRGAKTASAAPPPRLRRKSDGTVVLDLTQSISGSGIAALRANPNVTPGNVDLIAPRGTVDAGEAGIRALANLSIAARQVAGADNIQVGGQAAGLPVADTSGIGAAAASAAAAGTGKASEDAFKNTDASDDQQANLEVDVLGFGENPLQK